MGKQLGFHIFVLKLIIEVFCPPLVVSAFFKGILTAEKSCVFEHLSRVAFLSKIIQRLLRKNY